MWIKSALFRGCCHHVPKAHDSTSEYGLTASKINVLKQNKEVDLQQRRSVLPGEIVLKRMILLEKINHLFFLTKLVKFRLKTFFHSF